MLKVAIFMTAGAPLAFVRLEDVFSDACFVVAMSLPSADAREACLGCGFLSLLRSRLDTNHSRSNGSIGKRVSSSASRPVRHSMSTSPQSGIAQRSSAA
jgi:hypothetical protein